MPPKKTPGFVPPGCRLGKTEAGRDAVAHPEPASAWITQSVTRHTVGGEANSSDPRPFLIVSQVV